MSNCPICDKKVGFLIRSNKTGYQHRCHDCEIEAEKEYGVERNDVITMGSLKINTFEPYEMTDGPIYKIPDSDPNKIKNKDGVGDADRIFIGNKKQEKHYLDAMGCRIAEKGEKSQGHTIAMKEFKKRTYFIKTGLG